MKPRYRNVSCHSEWRMFARGGPYMMPVTMGPMMLAWISLPDILLDSQRKVKNEIRMRMDTTKDG